MKDDEGMTLRKQVQAQIAGFCTKQLSARMVQDWLDVHGSALRDGPDNVAYHWAKTLHGCLNRHWKGELDEDAARKCALEAFSGQDALEEPGTTSE